MTRQCTHLRIPVDVGRGLTRNTPHESTAVLWRIRRTLLTLCLAGSLQIFSLFLAEPAGAAKWDWQAVSYNSVEHRTRQKHPKTLESEFGITEAVRHCELLVQYRGPHFGRVKFSLEHHRVDGSVSEYRYAVKRINDTPWWRIANNAGTPIDFRLRAGDIIFVKLKFRRVEERPQPTTHLWVSAKPKRTPLRSVLSDGLTFEVAAPSNLKASPGYSASMDHWGRTTLGGPALRQHPKQLVSTLRLTKASTKTAVCVTYASKSLVGEMQSTARFLRSDGSSSEAQVELEQPHSYSGLRRGCTGRRKTADGDWIEVISTFKNFDKVGTVRHVVSTKSEKTERRAHLAPE